MSSSQRLAFICPRYPEHGTVGGAETLICNLAQRAALAGHEVHILTTCASDHFTWENRLPPGERTVGPVQVHFFPVDEDRDVEAFLRVQGAISLGAEVSREEEERWIRNSVNSRALLDHLRQHSDYDLLLAGPYLFGITWSVATAFPEKTRLIPCLHDEVFAYLAVMNEMFGAVSGCLFNTEPERALARRLYGIDESHSHVVGMGMEPFSADPGAFARRHGIDRPYLVYSGRREPMKGTPLLTGYVHAFRKRTGRDLRLVFTGSGPIDAPSELEPYILDVGFVSEQEKHEAMAGALAFCHPSANESLGIVVLESWLAERPALVTAASEVLVDQCRKSRGGLWFRNYPEFEEELFLLMDRPDLANAMGQAGRAYVEEEYAWEAVDQRLFAALQAQNGP